MSRTLYARQNQYPNLPGWTAYIEGEDDLGPDNITGFGNTRDEAVADLEERLTETAVGYLHEITARCVEMSPEILDAIERCRELETEEK